MARPVKTVALVDWHWAGHHPTCLKLYASALAENGVDVVPFAPAPAEVPALLQDTPAARSAPALARIDAARQFDAPAHLPVRPRWLQRIQQQASTFRRLGRTLRAWERETGRKIDTVFFNTIYDHDFSHASWLAALMGCDWAGLYLHARCIRTPGAIMPGGGRVPAAERMFGGRRLRGIGVLDAGAVSPLQSVLGERPVVLFPDVTDDRLPTDAAGGGLARRVLEFARGRPVVALVGHIHRSKGIEAFTRAAVDPRLAHVFFFVGGAANLSGLSPAAQAFVANAWESAPNIYAHLHRVQDERDLNAVVNACDVVYAAYVDFPHSSNVLTKAAVFRKPIIVSTGHLMGEQVREYDLGLTVPQDDAEAVVRGILDLTAGTAATTAPRWGDFAARHSYERLREAFGELLG